MKLVATYVAASIAFATAAAGCGPSRLLDRPVELPPAIQSRPLWHTPAAYIFARDKTLAGETERWIEEIDAHLRRTYDATLGKGLVIVVDEGEPAVLTSVEEVLRLQRANSRVTGVAPDGDADAAAQQEALAKIGFSQELYCRMSIVTLDDEALRRMGVEALPPDVEWTMHCPSHAMMRAAVWEFAPAVLEKELGKAGAIATAWAWPLAFGESAKAFRLSRDVLAFQLWAGRQEDWSPEKRREQVAGYMRQRAVIHSPLLGLALEGKGPKGAGENTAEPASRPASQPAD